MNEIEFEECSLCRFYESTDQDFGNCRRKPPVVLEKFVTPESGCDFPDSNSIANASVFPIVCAENWCGEFKSRAGRYALKDEGQ